MSGLSVASEEAETSTKQTTSDIELQKLSYILLHEVQDEADRGRQESAAIIMTRAFEKWRAER